MQKMSVSVPDSIMEAIDVETKRLGVSRSHFVAEGIDFYIGSGRNLKNEIDKLNEELMIKTEKAKSLSDKVLKLEESVPTIENKLAETKKELNSKSGEVFQKDKKIHTLAEKLKERIGSALQAKEEEIAFLRGHVAQLTQGISQLSLPPSQEEARAKSWWQFWH